MNHRRARWNVAKVALGLLLCLSNCHVTCNHDGGVRRRVVVLKPLAHIVKRCAVQILHRADNGMRIGMANRVSCLDDQFLSQSIRLVLTLLFLILDQRRAARSSTSWLMVL